MTEFRKMVARRINPAAAVLLVASLVILWRLSEPNWDRGADGHLHFVLDESIYAVTAHRYLLRDPHAWNPHATRANLLELELERDDLGGQSYYQVQHPPLANHLVALGIAIFGWKPFGARISSAICGIAILWLTYFWARRARGGSFASYAAILLACDGAVFVMSRVAMANIHSGLASIAAAYAAYRACSEPTSRARWLLGTGAILGLGLAVKWTIGPFAVVLAVVTFVSLAKSWKRSDAGAWLLAFVIIPAGVYFAAYIPFFIWWDGSIGELVELQRAMWRHHQNLGAEYVQSSPWYSWPLMSHPLQLYLSRIQTPDGPMVRTIYLLGNPLLWWLFVPAVVGVVVRWARKRDVFEAIVVFGFLSFWLPWAVIDRYGFMLNLLQAVPFGVLAVAIVFEELIERFGRVARVVRAAHAIFAIAVFINLYPILSAVRLEPAEARSRRYFWIDGWRRDSPLFRLEEPGGEGG